MNVTETTNTTSASLAMNLTETANTTSAANSKTIAFVGSESPSNNQLYSIEYNSETQTLSLVATINVSFAQPSWISLNPVDPTMMLVTYEGAGMYQNFNVTSNGGLIAASAPQSAGMGPVFSAFDPSGKFAGISDFTNGGYTIIQNYPNGTSVSITQNMSSNDPNRFLGPNSNNASHPHQFVVNPSVPIAYIPNLAANVVSTYDFANGTLTFQETLTISGGPRHMVINNNGTLAWLVTEDSCQVQPLKIDGTGKLSLNGVSVNVTQPGQLEGECAEVVVTRDSQALFVSNRQLNTTQPDFITKFDVNIDGTLANATSYNTGGQNIRSMTLNNDSSMLLFGHLASGTVGMFGIDPQTKNLTMLTQTLLNLTSAANLSASAEPATFVFSGN